MGEGYGANNITASRGDEIQKYAQKVMSFLPQEIGEQKRLELVIVELLTNAIFYGIRGEPPEKKEMWDHDFELSEGEAIHIKALWDDKKYAISILDKGGRLKKEDVLYWLHRQIGKGVDGLPIGVMDSHGRGLYIARKYIDRVLINIDTDKRTEIIIINYYNEQYSGFKPLYINEI